MSSSLPLPCGVSVCLLTYNHEHVIANVLDSVLDQTYRDFELIVSDDCSTDGTWRVVQGYAARDPRISRVQTPRNLGMAGNANFAIGRAKGRYVVLLHHDDRCVRDMLTRLLSVVEAANHVGFVFSDYLINAVPIHSVQKQGFARVMQGKRFLRKRLLRNWGCPIHGTALIRKSCFDEIGGMDLRFGLLADVDLWMRLAARWDVGYVGEPIIEVGCARPADYPKEYTTFTWRRHKLLMEIHATNICREYPKHTLVGLLKWLQLRVRISAETTKWLLYAAVRAKRDMLRSASEGASEYEFFFVGLLRRLLWRLSR